MSRGFRISCERLSCRCHKMHWKHECYANKCLQPTRLTPAVSGGLRRCLPLAVPRIPLSGGRLKLNVRRQEKIEFQ